MDVAEMGTRRVPWDAALARHIAGEVVAGLEQGGRAVTHDTCEQVLADVRARLVVVAGSDAAAQESVGQSVSMEGDRRGDGRRDRRAPRILLGIRTPALHALIRQELVREGYVVESVDKAQAVWASVQNNLPDLIWLDVEMTGQIINDVCRPLRRATSIPILLFGPDDDDTIIAGFNAGADDYVPMSMSVREALARVQVALRRDRMLPARQTATHSLASSSTPDGGRRSWQAQHAAVEAVPVHVHTGDLVIDVEHCTATRDGRALRLTRLEGQLLVTLARQLGQVVPSDVIAEAVWGDQLRKGNNLWIAISRLRRKIEPDPGRPVYITNSAHAGYILERLP